MPDDTIIIDVVVTFFPVSWSVLVVMIRIKFRRRSRRHFNVFYMLRRGRGGMKGGQECLDPYALLILHDDERGHFQ